MEDRNLQSPSEYIDCVMREKHTYNPQANMSSSLALQADTEVVPRSRLGGTAGAAGGGDASEGAVGGPPMGLAGGSLAGGVSVAVSTHFGGDPHTEFAQPSFGVQMEQPVMRSSPNEPSWGNEQENIENQGEERNLGAQSEETRSGDGEENPIEGQAGQPSREGQNEPPLGEEPIAGQEQPTIPGEIELPVNIAPSVWSVQTASTERVPSVESVSTRHRVIGVRSLTMQRDYGAGESPGAAGGLAAQWAPQRNPSPMPSTQSPSSSSAPSRYPSSTSLAQSPSQLLQSPSQSPSQLLQSPSQLSQSPSQLSQSPSQSPRRGALEDDGGSLGDDAARQLCKVCFVGEANMALMPCGHCLCIACANRLTDCPMCRTHIRGTLRTFQ